MYTKGSTFSNNKRYKTIESFAKAYQLVLLELK